MCIRDRGGGFARAVGTDQGDDLARVDGEGDILYGVDVAIVDVYKRQVDDAQLQNIRLFKELSVIDNIKVGLHESMKYNLCLLYTSYDPFP